MKYKKIKIDKTAIVEEFAVGGREKGIWRVVVYKKEKGSQMEYLVDIRKWFVLPTGEVLPTKKGITLPYSGAYKISKGLESALHLIDSRRF